MLRPQLRTPTHSLNPHSDDSGADDISALASAHTASSDTEAPPEYDAEDDGLPLFTWSQLEDATGHFASTSVCGRGASSVVYRGRISQHDRDVAIKVLTEAAGADSEAVAESHAAFLHEAKQLSECQHPNIARFVGVGCEPGGLRRAIVSEFVSGGNLRTRLSGAEASVSPLTWVQRVTVLVGACRGIAYLHEQLGQVHRDVKPLNILLDEGATKGILSDLGLVRASSRTFCFLAWFYCLDIVK